MKSTDGDTDAAEQMAVKTGDLTRVEYEEKLVQCNRQLASVRSECNRLEAINDEAVIAYERACERREDVLGEFGRRIYEQEVRLEAYETERRQLSAHRAAWDEVFESRQAQYDRALAGLKSNREFKESKWITMEKHRNNRANLMDAITSVSEQVEYLKEKHREGLYAVGQSLVCRKANLNYEQERKIESVLEMIIINQKCNQNDLIQNITKYYGAIKEIVKNQKQGLKIRKELKKFIKKYEDKELDIILQNDEIETLISLHNLLDEKINNLTKQNEIAKMKRKELISEVNANEKCMLEGNLKCIQTMKIFENDMKTINSSFNDLQQDIIIVNELQKQKCNYIKKITDEVLKIAHEIKKYLTGEKQLTDYPENLNWLLNMIRPLMHNIKTIKTVKACNNK